MATQYFLAPEVDDIARPIIRKYHEHLINHQVRVDFYFRDDKPKSKGKVVWGRAYKVSGLNAFLANTERSDNIDEQNKPFFVIVITEPIWRRLSFNAREGLVHHELKHCEAYVDDKGEVKLSLAPHDDEFFYDEIEHYGLWRPSLEQMAETIQNRLARLPLPERLKPEELEEVGRRFVRAGELIGEMVAGRVDDDGVITDEVSSYVH